MKSLKKIFVIFAVVTAFGATAAFADGGNTPPVTNTGTGQTNAPCNSNNGNTNPPAPAAAGNTGTGTPAAGGATTGH